MYNLLRNIVKSNTICLYYRIDLFEIKYNPNNVSHIYTDSPIYSVFSFLIFKISTEIIKLCCLYCQEHLSHN
jgi:hypothetical protein